MPRGPKGERRPADVIGNAVKVMRIATGEEPEDYGPDPNRRERTQLPWRSVGRAGRRARQACLRESEKRMSRSGPSKWAANPQYWVYRIVPRNCVWKPARCGAYRTGLSGTKPSLCQNTTEIGIWRPETGARNPAGVAEN
jgi:hypothetical protein